MLPSPCRTRLAKLVESWLDHLHRGRLKSTLSLVKRRRLQTLPSFLQQELPEIASEFSAQWAGSCSRDRLGGIAEFGRCLPTRFASISTEALDPCGQGACRLTDGRRHLDNVRGALQKRGRRELLVVCGRGLGGRRTKVWRRVGWASKSSAGAVLRNVSTGCGRRCGLRLNSARPAR